MAIMTYSRSDLRGTGAAHYARSTLGEVRYLLIAPRKPTHSKRSFGPSCWEGARASFRAGPWPARTACPGSVEARGSSPHRQRKLTVPQEANAMRT